MGIKREKTKHLEKLNKCQLIMMMMVVIPMTCIFLLICHNAPIQICIIAAGPVGRADRAASLAPLLSFGVESWS